MADDRAQEPERRAVEMPYIADRHAYALCEFLARVDGLSNGRAPLWVRAVPEEDWSRASRDPLVTSPDISHAIDVLSGAGARQAEIAIVFKRILRRVSPIVHEEVQRYLDGDGEAD